MINTGVLKSTARRMTDDNLAEEYQGEVMFGTNKPRGRKNIKAHNNSLREGGYEGEKQLIPGL
jgi:hypothetical protein